MPRATIRKISAGSVAANTRRGGDIRVLLSPRTVGAESGFLGVLTLLPDQYVSEHYHPYSEEFLYTVHGNVRLTIDGEAVELCAGDAIMVAIGLRHRLTNIGSEAATIVFHLSPLAPRPDLGHVDTEPLPGGVAAIDDSERVQ